MPEKKKVTTYVALLRGIMPMNPNMKSEKLKGFFESLGFDNIRTVIASGNVVFDVPLNAMKSNGANDVAKLEEKIEKELPKQLGFTSTTMVRSREELLDLVKKDPFKGVKDERPNYLVVTFFKDRRDELCTVLDITNGPDQATKFMSRIEKENSKALTTRTWKTVARILKKME